MEFLEFLLKDSLFFWLVWASFTVSGVIIGWFLRANFPENEVRIALQRTEQERNTLARLYTHLKHQHDLREADFKRTSLELNNFRQYVAVLEAEKNARPLLPDQETRIQKAEANATRFYEQVSVLESSVKQLQQKNSELNAQLQHAHEELGAWQVLYRDFQVLQQRLTIFEQKSAALEAERDDLLAQLKSTRIEIENLQLDILQQPAPQQKPAARSDRKGGPAAPEQTDDLKIINGISPFAEQQLHALGIHSFSQISRWDDDSVLAFAKALNISPAKIFQEDWVGQAQHLVREHL